MEDNRNHLFFELDRDRAIRFYDELNTSIISPDDTIARRIIALTDDFIFHLNDSEYSIDIGIDLEYFLLMEAKRMNQAFNHFHNVKINDSLQILTFREIFNSICTRRKISNITIFDRLKSQFTGKFYDSGIKSRYNRFSIDRTELFKRKGLGVSNHLKKSNNNFYVFMQFCGQYYFNKSEREIDRDWSIYSNFSKIARKTFDRWVDECVENNYYFLSAMNTPLGKYIRRIQTLELAELEIMNKFKIEPVY